MDEDEARYTYPEMRGSLNWLTLYPAGRGEYTVIVLLVQWKQASNANLEYHLEVLVNFIFIQHIHQWGWWTGQGVTTNITYATRDKDYSLPVHTAVHTCSLMVQAVSHNTLYKLSKVKCPASSRVLPMSNQMSVLLPLPTQCHSHSPPSATPTPLEIMCNAHKVLVQTVKNIKCSPPPLLLMSRSVFLTPHPNFPIHPTPDQVGS